MKKAIIITVVLGLLVLAGAVLAPPAIFIYRMSRQMDAGRAVLDALTEPELELWLARSEALWKKFEGHYDMGVYHDGIRPLPSDLAALKLIRIDVYDDSIYYVWVGGMDHCSLIVERKSDGYAYFTAEYSDDKRKELPKLKRK